MFGHSRRLIRNCCKVSSSALHTLVPPASSVCVGKNESRFLKSQRSSSYENKSFEAIRLPFLNPIDLLQQEVTKGYDLPNKNNLPSIVPKNILDMVYQEPSGHNKSIVDPSEHVDKESPGINKSPMYAHKSHLYWRRRRMRRHRLMRWRKKHHRIVREREARKLRIRKRKHMLDMKNAWEGFGLSERPPALSKDEADAYIKQWKESGLLVDILDRDECLKYAGIQRVVNKTDAEEKARKRTAKGRK